MSDQIALFEAESDGALFLVGGELSKRYTGAQVRAIEAKRALILLCVGAGVPVETIATQAGVTSRTVQALAAAELQKVAGNKKEVSGRLMGLGGRWFNLATLKEGDANALQLAMMGSMAIQRANELQVTAEVEEEKIVDVDGGGAVEARDRVRKFLAAAGLAPAVGVEPDENKAAATIVNVVDSKQVT